MSEKLLLIDGHSILNRAYFGVPDLTNSEGLHTNAVYGFLNIMFRMIDEEKPDYLAVAFDLKAPTFRHKIYEAYKGTRKPMQQELREQVPVIKTVLNAMKIPLLMLEGYEADDLLGTAAKSAEEKGMDVSVVSGDRDLLQLATDKIKIRIPKTKRGKTEVEDYFAADVVERYQVTPLQIIELKALMGDSSDNIPGIPGVGEKTATKIIVEYGSIENAHDHAEEIKPNRAKESLIEHYDMAQLSKTLATINTKSPITLDLEQAKMKDLFTPEVYELFAKLEFKNLMNRFEADVSQNKVEEKFRIVRELTEAEELLNRAAAAGRFGFAVIAEEKELAGVGLSLSEEETVYFPVEGFLTEAYLSEKITAAVEAAELAATVQLKEQLEYVDVPREKEGIFFDAALAAYLLNPLKGEYGYEDIAKDALNQAFPGRAQLLGKAGFREFTQENCPENKSALYACYLAYTALAAQQVLRKKLKEAGMERLFDEVEMPLVFTLFGMQQEGVRVNAEELKEYSTMLGKKIALLEASIYERAGEKFNINSPKQLGTILFEKMQLPGAKKTKSGYSTAADVLEKLRSEHPIVDKILEYRQLAKLKSTYADGLVSYISEDGRIHGTFNQTITATGRISSTDPNLQNIPIRTELGRLFRKVFIPREGEVFVDADYSQIELRVLAALSKDEAMIEAFREKQDIHRMTASQVFHLPFEEVTELQRRNAKAVNFGIVYGISAFGLSEDLGISRKEAQDYIARYFQTYPKIKEFLDQSVANAKEKGYADTFFGRRRPVPELAAANFMQRSFGERVAMNSPIQGTAADIIKIAMIRVDRRLKEEGLKARLILQIHDELLIETPAEERERVREILQEEMTGAVKLPVDMEIDVKTGKDWYEAH
ncbi:MAG: DNA polymerase I [Eubacteriales bacterium]|nr:DNA polymerase I [Eubacteriales bacterium]